MNSFNNQLDNFVKKLSLEFSACPHISIFINSLFIYIIFHYVSFSYHMHFLYVNVNYMAFYIIFTL